MKRDYSKKILDEFEEQKTTNSLCVESALTLLKSVLDINKIKYHSINGRIKEKEKVKEKILRKEGKYKSLKDITDIIGVRIITYFEDEIDKIADIIKNEFEIDPINSVDKRIIENDRFGYRSLHYVASFNTNRLIFTEYKPYKDLKFEIQIRTILQHGWAEIEHDLGYKGEFEIPDIAKRSFYRLAALLETADIEFVHLKKIIVDYEKSLASNFNMKQSNLSLDKASLEAFVTKNPLIPSIREKLIPLYSFVGNNVDFTENVDYSKLIERLQKLKIETLDQLEKALLENQDAFLNHFKRKYDGHQIIAMNIAAPIYRLLNYLESK